MEEKLTLIAIHILPDCPKHIRKVLDENEWYFFNRMYREKNGKLVINESYSVPKNLYSPKINIQAIVGKNGSGKSSVIELVLRLINNLAYYLISNASTDTELHFIDQLNAELFYNMGGTINSLRCENNKVYLDQGDGYIAVGKYLDTNDDLQKNSIGQNVSLKEAIPLLQKFFFTIVNNYSFHAYNANDFLEEFEDRVHVWINGLFHKNDGYLTPLVLNPFRDIGKIDMEREKKLTNIRLASLFYLFKKEGINFINEYEYKSISFSLNENHVKNKYKYYPSRKGVKLKNARELVVRVQSKKNDIYNTTLKYYFDTIIEDERLEQAYKYLVYKTFAISSKYPNYSRFIKFGLTQLNKHCLASDKIKIKKLVEKIKSDPSHTTLKIKQTLKFIEFVISLNKQQNTKDSEYKHLDRIDEEYIDYMPREISLYEGLSYFDRLIASFPPPFYEIAIFLKTSKGESVTFEKMSSGERQFLFYMSTLLYHLKNLDSVIEGDESVHFKYVNIILEEVELYFHPEYQRQFISKLINYLEACQFNNLEYFNVIIATHSPFILSDIPQDNIMFLDNGKQVNDTVGMVTFGANIHDMLRNSFFLEQGLIGDFAKGQIKRVMCFLDNDCNQDLCSEKEIQKIIEMIGEPLIKDRLQSMLNSKNRITEIDRLKNRIKELEARIS